MSEPTADQPVVLDAPAADGLQVEDDHPAGQIEHPAVPTPADAIDHDQPEGATPAVADADPRPEVEPGTPAMLLPPGAYIETDE